MTCSLAFRNRTGGRLDNWAKQLAETPALASPLKASFQREPASDLFGEVRQVRGVVFLHRPSVLRAIGQPPADPLLGLRSAISLRSATESFTGSVQRVGLFFLSLKRFHEALATSAVIHIPRAESCSESFDGSVYSCSRNTCA